MNLASKILLPLGATAALGAAVAFPVLRSEFGNAVQRTALEHVEGRLSRLHDRLTEQSRSCLANAALFARDPVVREIYLEAVAGRIDVADDAQVQRARERLARYMDARAQSFVEYTKLPVFKLHFHFPNGRSFLRVWRRETQRASDDISGFRKTVLEVGSGRRPFVSGIEVGRGGLALRGVVPIRGEDDGILGSVEYLADLTQQVIGQELESNERFAVFLHAPLTEIATKLADPAKNPVRGQHVLLGQTEGDEGAGQLRAISEAELDAGLAAVHRNWSEEEFHATEPLHDYAGRTVGVLAYQLDASEILAARSAMELRLLWLTLAIGTVFSAVLGAVVFWISRTVKGLVTQSDGVARASEELQREAEQIREGARSTSERIVEASRQAEGLAANMEQISATTELNTENVQEVSGSLQEMDMRIGEVHEQVGSAAKTASDASRISSETETQMASLQAAADEIGQVIEVIQGIAQQTNLLALNATVEAARAGEAGKGFSVVASEVKNLALQTTEAIEKVRGKIEQIQAQTSSSVESTQAVAGIIAQLEEVSSAVATAMDEQRSSAGAISRRVGELASASKEVSENVVDSAGRTQEITRYTTDVEQIASETNQSSERVYASSARLEQMARTLDGLLSKLS